MDYISENFEKIKTSCLMSVTSEIIMISKPHKDLDVWKKSIDLISKVYEITMNFPQYEKFGIISQMRRSAISIASNIGEGAARQTKKQFSYFLYLARGSLSELDTQFEISKKLGYVEERNMEEISELAIRIDQMITGLIKSIKKSKNLF